MANQMIDTMQAREAMLAELKEILSDEFNELSYPNDTIEGIYGVYTTVNVKSVGSTNSLKKIVVTQLPNEEYVSWSFLKGWNEDESVGPANTQGEVVLTPVTRQVRLVEVEEWV